MSRKPPILPAETVLPLSGHRARLSTDIFRRGGVVLAVDGVAQSQVNLEDPTDLAFDYIQRMAHVVDFSAPQGEPITAMHLGAGALTLPRYIDHTRPGSEQTVFEWEPEILELVRSHIPWNQTAISTVIGDARESLERYRAEALADLVVVDLFSGNHTPSHLTTQEFYGLLLDVLAPEGLVVVNVVDGGERSFARRQCRTLAKHFGFVGATGEAQVVTGRVLGNFVIVARRNQETPEWWSEYSGLGPHPTGVIAGESMVEFCAGAAVQTDADFIPSPQLSRSYS